jgi:hypothetical protein
MRGFVPETLALTGTASPLKKPRTNARKALSNVSTTVKRASI